MRIDSHNDRLDHLTRPADRLAESAIGDDAPLLLSTHLFATHKPHVLHSPGLTYTKPHIRLDVSIRSVGCGVRDWTRCLHLPCSVVAAITVHIHR